MARPALALAALMLGVAFLSAGCDDEPEDRVAAMPKRSVTVGGATFEMSLPARAVLRADGGATTIDFAPGMRQPKAIRLALPQSGEGPALVNPRTLRLPSGASLSYVVERSSGGSGGPEALLRGRLVDGATTLTVSCHIQAEGSPDGEWCIPYLRSLRRIRK